MPMFLETVRTPGLAHNSYVVGHDGRAAVIDPRRDVDAYLDLARARGAAVTHVFETHRNEDYVTGAPELARLTGATVVRGRNTNVEYGQKSGEGEVFGIGGLTLAVLETPGHTFDSICLALTDTSSGPSPVAVFTGDTLFIGSTGRADFFPDRAREVAGLMHDAIFGKLLPLGDQAVLLPAHGAGSVCGSGMSEREFSTLGFERLHNPGLQARDREEFIAAKLAEHHPMPPYFARMAELNRTGSAPRLCDLPEPRPMGATEFAERMDQGMLVLDVRSPEAFAGAFIPGSLAIPLDLITAYAGFLLDPETPIGLVVEERGQVDTAVLSLRRMGFDTVAGWLEQGLHAWEVQGREFGRVPAVHAEELTRRIVRGEDFTLLDVRTPGEVAQGRLKGAQHIFLGDLPGRLAEVQDGRPVTTFCGSGQRAIIAASILKRAGFGRVEDALGSMAACRRVGCPME